MKTKTKKVIFFSASSADLHSGVRKEDKIQMLRWEIYETYFCGIKDMTIRRKLTREEVILFLKANLI